MKRFSLVMLMAGTALATALGVVRAGPPAQDAPDVFVANARADLELLADAALAPGQRPEDWTGTADPAAPAASADLWFDTELLAAALHSPQERPDGWIGATSTRADILARNVRHDLELLADGEFGAETRPPGWRGGPALNRCDRTLQNAAALLAVVTGSPLTTPAGTPNYCQAVAAEISDVPADAAVSADAARLADLTLAARGDLERLADETLGLYTRPVGYRRNTDPASATFGADLFLDLELLADETLGRAVRPPAWVGVIASDPALFYRNTRHDIELLADETLGPDARPRGWQNEDPLARCAPLVQNLVLFVQQAYDLVPDVAADSAYCVHAEAEANRIAENPPVLDVVEEAEGGRYLAESEYAFAYLDVAATQYMGIMPGGTRFRAWYRNYMAPDGESDSRMMFVSGDDFALYIDRRWTTLAEEEFVSLPTLEGVRPLAFCDARWCNGPAPTPTPTGSGPLELLLLQTTPAAPPPVDGDISGERTQVSWNHVRVTYLQDNAQTRTAQVALEICNETTQITCEPVIRVFDNALGVAKPVLSQFNGLNVYEFPYGYNTNLLIEGATLVSPDVWISDPTIR